MKIKDRPEFKRKAAVLTMRPDESVFAAVQTMSEKNYGAVIVVTPEGKAAGIVTERDFMRRLLDKELDPRQTPLSKIMTSDLKVARGDDDLLDWLRQMSNDRFRHLPIVDEDERVIGIMSQGDFVSYTWPQLLGRVKEHARATFDLSPSIVLAIFGVIVFLLIVIAAILLNT